MPPAFRATQQPVIQSTQASSHSCQSRSVNAFCLCPVFDDGRVRRFCTRPGRQIIWFFFEWSRQKPEILFVSLFILLDGEEGIIEIISQSGCLGLHMCKILFFCTLPK